MARNFLTPINLNGLELQGAAIGNLSTGSINAITSGTGRIQYDSTLNVLKYRDNSGWQTIATGGSTFTLGSTSISLGSTTTTVAGLSSVTSTTFVGALTGNVTGNVSGSAGSVANGLTFGTNLTASVGSSPYNGSAAATISLSATPTGITSINGVTMPSSGSFITSATTSLPNVTSVNSTTIPSSATLLTSASTASVLTSVGSLNGLTIAATQTVSMGGNKITNVGTPTADSDAATKLYVDSTAQGIDWKASVRAATTANGTLASAYANGSVVDGVTLATGNRILIKDQTTGSENGIYTVNASGAPTRAVDADTAAEIVASFAVFVEEGTDNADSGFVLTNNGTVTVGTTALTFTQFTGLGQVTAGTGLTKTGNTLNAVGTADRITANADSIDIASTYAGQSTITTLGTVATGTWNGSVIAGLYGGTGVANSGKTITLGGNLTTSGAFATTLTATGTTSVTLPTSGTLLTTAGSGSSLTFGTGSLSLAGNLTTSGAFATTITTTATTSVTLPTSGTLVNTAVATLSSLTSVGTIGTGVWQGTAVGLLYGGTGATTAAAARSNLGATTKVTLVGTGSGTTIALTHGLGTNLVTAQVYDTSTSTATLVETDITVTSTTATATFAATTTLSNYTLVVIG